MSDLVDLFETGLQNYFEQQHMVYVKKNDLPSHYAASSAQDIDFKDLMLPSRNYEKEMDKLMRAMVPETKSSANVPEVLTVFQQMYQLVMGMLPATEPVTPPPATSPSFDIHVKTLTGRMITIHARDDTTIDQLKLQIEILIGNPVDTQRLIWAGKQLEDNRTLADYKIPNKATIQLVLRLRGGMCLAFTNAPDKFDPAFHYDFTNISDQGKSFVRGGKAYTRPTGSKRMAIKVLGVYDDDAWLRGDSDGDWAVAYHGSTDPRTEEIVKCGGLKEKYARRTLYGAGIYCTPDPKTALAYATKYTYKGSNYKLIVQTRVHTKKMKVIPSSQHKIKGLDDYWVVPEDAIRMYGLCAYPIN